MILSLDPVAPCRQVYVLTLWRSTAETSWRAALCPAGSQERIGFADLEALVLFLLGLDESGAAGDRGQPGRAGGRRV